MSVRGSLLTIAILLTGTGPALAQSECKPPESMRENLKGTPTTDALNDLGVWFAEQKQYSCAATAFATSMQNDPSQKDVAHVAFMFGASLDLSGDTKEAIGALQEAEQLGYRDIKLHLMLAADFDASHATRDAEAEWRAALQMDPEYTAALDALAADLLADADYAGVIAALDQPRLKGQRTPLQCVDLGAAYAATGKLEQAANVLWDGLNTTPDSVAVADELAKVLLELKRDAEAARVLVLAGEAEIRSGDLKGARGHLQQAAKLGDSSEDLKRDLAKVESAPGAEK